MRIVPIALATAAALAGTAVVATPASARTFVSFGVGAPVYPAYYGGYYPGYYAPAYYPGYAPYYGGVVVGGGGWYGHRYYGGGWRHGYYGRGYRGGYRGHGGWHHR
jgi:hypothetical protein